MLLASMWLDMLFAGPSFPHMLQMASLFRPSLLRTFARVIVDLICSSRSAESALIGVFEIATISTGFVMLVQTHLPRSFFFLENSPLSSEHLQLCLFCPQHCHQGADRFH